MNLALPSAVQTSLARLWSLMADRRLRATLLLLAGALVLLWGGVWLHLGEVRRQAERSAQNDADNLARSLEQNIIRSIEGADQMLRFLQATYAGNPAGFDLFTWINAWQPADGLAVQLVLIGADGRMRASSVERSTAPVDLSDREHFRVHLGGGDNLFISKPVLGRVTRRWTIQFTRPALNATGGFEGVLVLSMDTAYLSRFYSALSIGLGSVALVGEDGVVRARAPFLANALGERVPDTIMARVLGQRQGAYRGVGSFDGIERLYSFRSVANYPLIVFVGLDLQEAFTGWRLDRQRSLLAGGFVTLAMLAAACFLLRQHQAKTRGDRALAVTLERLTQGVVMAGTDGRVQVMNQRAAELLELPARLAHPGAMVVDMLASLGRAMPGGAAGMRERRRADGSTVETQVLPLPDGGVLLTSTDVTAQRAMAHAQEAARTAAEAANQAKSDFLANMSHEIRTPMNGVLGMIQLLRHSALDPQQRGWCETITHSADALLGVVNDILDYSKLEAGRIELEALPCDVPTLVREVADLLRASASAKGLELTLLQPGAPPPPLLLDPTRLRQIVLNLLSNAVKFSHAGEIGVTLSSSLAEDGREALRISVRDQGIGIPAAALATLFTRFTQADATSTRRFGGSGLGLAISQELARLMGGEILVRSVVGEGSEFILILTVPVATTPAAPLVPVLAGELPSLRILVAEDDEVNRQVIDAFLQPGRHRVAFVLNGAEAVAAVQEQTFDLVLMDAMMPGMDGPTATAQIRALPETLARLPIIALTANAMVGDRERYLAAGMDGYVSKPINRQGLQAEIARVLGLGLTVESAPPAAPMVEIPDDLAAELEDIFAELR
jgi:signal transduction histidine kinase/CheY-like chemotaxis protein